MKIDFSQKILQLDGKPMRAEDGKDFALSNAAVTALDAVTEEVKTLDPKEKFRRGQLASRIYRAKEPIRMTVDEVALIKKLIGSVFGPHIVYEAWNLLDPPDAVEDDETKEPTPMIPGGEK